MTTETDAGEPWHRLDPRLAVMHLSMLAPPIAGYVGTLVVGGGRVPTAAYTPLISVGAAFLVMTVGGLVRYATTRYRITDARVELSSGLLVHRRLSIPRDRIRSVDLTANPLQRVFGLTAVKIGTGQHAAGPGDSELALNAVTRARADELRHRLLDRAPKAKATTTATPAAPVEPVGDVTIATMNWAWLRYAPLSVWTLIFAGIVFGSAYRVLDAIGIDPVKSGLVSRIARWALAQPLWADALLLVAIVLGVGVVCTIAVFVESWWGFRLVHEANGVFRVRRGLFTTRSTSLEERRLRGVEIVEGVFHRWVGAAQPKVIATGLKTGHNEKEREKDALHPPAPREVVQRVSARVLDESQSPAALTRLRPHPHRALRRRLNRAVVPFVVIAVALAAGGLAVHWLLWCAVGALAMVVLTVPFAVDAYRGLGHGLAGRYLVTRYGSAGRRTVALRRDGVIGWTVTRSFFQRRGGLLTLTATTAAGHGAYKVRDVAEGEGLAFAEEAVPDLLAPFLEHRDLTGAAAP